MAPSLKKYFVIVCIYLAITCFYPLASAFVLQGQHILEIMAEKLGQAESLFVSQKVVFYSIGPPPTSPETAEADSTATEDAVPPDSNPGAESAPAADSDALPLTIEMEESVRYLFPEAFRSDIFTDDNQRIHVFANNQALTVIGGATRAAPQTRFDYYKDILLLRSRPQLVERLTQLNLDVSVSSLGRFEGRLAFVIGALYPDESVNQLWVDQTSFRPLRWIITDGSGGFQANTFEIRYLDWWQFDDTFWYPMRIEFYQNTVLVRVIKAQRYELNPAFSFDLFDIERIRSTYPQASPALNDSGESESISEVQRTIDEFSKMFE
jgi:hypothetical protein